MKFRTVFFVFLVMLLCSVTRTLAQAIPIDSIHLSDPFIVADKKTNMFT